MSYPPSEPDPNRPQDRPQDATRPLPTYGRPPEPPPVQANPYQQQPYGQQPTYPQQPQYGQQPPQYGQVQYPAPYGYGYPGTQLSKTNSLAIAALICGLGGLVIGVSAPVGVGLGIAALVQIKRRGESGTGLAVGGIVSGGLVTLFGLGMLLIVILIGAGSDDYQGRGGPDGVTYADSLAVGECFDDGFGEDEVYRRDCTEPHDGEITSNVTLQAMPYPGTNRLDDLAQDQCDAEFGKYVGNTADKSELTSTFWVPTKDEWGNGNRLVICAAYGPDDEDLTSSVKGSKR